MNFLLKWEDLKVYKPLTKEELKPAFKDFINIIAENLKSFGFALHGRKLIKISNDLLQIIHLDTRGSWAGINEYFKIEISLIAVSDKSPLLRGTELTSVKKIEEIVSGLRNHYRITKEYPLLADFFTRIIVEKVFPYLDKFDSSVKVLNQRVFFKLNQLGERNENLILFCELQNAINVEALKIIEKSITFYSQLNSKDSKNLGYLEELELYKSGLQSGNWLMIEQQLSENRIQNFKKLKIR